MIEKENLNQMEQSSETANNDNIVVKELSETLQTPEYPQIVLSQPGEDSPKIKTYKVNNSYFANKGCSRSEGSRTYSIQDLVTIETGHYCSPDGRDYSNYISKINLFPSEEDFPEEFDNTYSNNYGSGQYDYLLYDKENKKIFYYSTGNQLSSQDHYFWVSPDSTVLFPGIETVHECNGGYFHHIVLDNQSDYKYVDKKSIQETINALFDQKREMEKIEEYREKNGDIGLELSWTEYSTGWYEPRVYMGDKHGIPAHEHSDESWKTNKLLVKFGKPGDYINFCRGGEWYTVTIDENKIVEISNHTSCRWNNNQDWWYEEMDSSSIQPGQIFINGEDVYDFTTSRISERQKETKESRKSKFSDLKSKLTDEYKFTESEFQNLCKYAGKGNIIKFLSTIKSIIETCDVQKNEIFDAMLDIKYPGEMVFGNYILIKREAIKYKYEDVKRVVDKGYAWSYITDTIKGINRFGNFDDAIAALKLALDNGLFRKGDLVYTSRTQENTISDLGQLLLDAGIVAKN